METRTSPLSIVAPAGWAQVRAAATGESTLTRVQAQEVFDTLLESFEQRNGRACLADELLCVRLEPGTGSSMKRLRIRTTMCRWVPAVRCGMSTSSGPAAASKSLRARRSTSCPSFAAGTDRRRTRLRSCLVPHGHVMPVARQHEADHDEPCEAREAPDRQQYREAGQEQAHE